MRRFLALALAVSLTAVASPAQAATYTQPVWFFWNKTTLDVIIVPPEHGQVYNGNGVLGGSEGGVSEVTPFNSYLRAIEHSIAAWRTATARWGSTSLRNRLVINSYVLGRDTIPQAALTGPEIVITTDQSKAVILGVSVSSRPCLIDNSKFFVTSYTYADMFNVSGHEFGHCLGLDHSTGAGGVIAHDIIFATYSDAVGAAGNHLHCPSNLNVLGLEEVYQAAMGLGAGSSSASIADSSYQRPATC